MKIIKILIGKIGGLFGMFKTNHSECVDYGKRLFLLTIIPEMRSLTAKDIQITLESLGFSHSHKTLNDACYYDIDRILDRKKGYLRELLKRADLKRRTIAVQGEFAARGWDMIKAAEHDGRIVDLMPPETLDVSFRKNMSVNQVALIFAENMISNEGEITKSGIQVDREANIGMDGKYDKLTEDVYNRLSAFEKSPSPHLMLSKLKKFENNIVYEDTQPLPKIKSKVPDVKFSRTVRPQLPSAPESTGIEILAERASS